MRVLVTGASGFVGNAVMHRLLADGVDVRAALRVPMALGVPSVIIPGIDSKTDWREALSGVDAVVHLAAHVHRMRPDGSDEEMFREVNARGTHRLATAAAEAGVRHLVFMSTIKVCGEHSERPLTESDPTLVDDAYGRSKREAEEGLREITARTGLRTSIVRPPLVYGEGVKANFLRLIGLVDRRIPLPLGAVRNRRSVIYVGNLADAVLHLLRREGEPSETFFATDGEDLPTPDLVRLIGKKLGKRAILLPVSPFLMRAAGSAIGRRLTVERLTGSLQADSSKLRSTGWTPPFTTAQGIEYTVLWYRLHAEWSSQSHPSY